MAVINWKGTGKQPEREAGLYARMQLVIRTYGGIYAFCKYFNIPYSTVRGWRRIPHTVATRIHKDNPRRFSASFCRHDLRWDQYGRLKGSDRRKSKVYS